MANKELIEKVCAAAEAHPEHHDQVSFFSFSGPAYLRSRVPLWEMKTGQCDTSACLAGFATLFTADPTCEVDDYRLYSADGNPLSSIECHAQAVLGLTDGQTEVIFYCNGEKEAIARLRYVAGHPDATADDLEREVPYYEADCEEDY